MKSVGGVSGCFNEVMPKKVWPVDESRDSRGPHGVHGSEPKGTNNGEWELIMYASRSFDNLADVQPRAKKVTCWSSLAPRRSNSFSGMHTVVHYIDQGGSRRATHVRLSGRHVTHPVLTPCRDVSTPTSEVSAASTEERELVEAAIKNFR